MARVIGNIEKTWNVRGPVDASGISVESVAPFFYLAHTDRDPGGADREWVYLLGDCDRWSERPFLEPVPGLRLFVYSTPTGHLKALADTMKVGRCFLLKQDRSLWQAIDIEFGLSPGQPAFLLIGKRRTHADSIVTRLAFDDGPEHELAELAHKRSDAELRWAADQGGSVAKAELMRRLATAPPAAGGPARDPLTDVETRAGLDAYLRDVREHSAVFPLAFLSIDLDSFKPVNDTRGHGAGDRALRTVALQAATCAHPRGRTFRVGGDEFLVVRENCDSAEAARTGEQIRSGVAQAKIPDAKGEFSVTVSVGVAVARSPAELDEVIERADAALYEAKRGGRNRVAPA